eukprot:CAMPEP_0175178216 /NCGR_PEP_ID=MMETSP0087-20121206/34826_1 /TAXON_ID=136419 /ORGANISM="Unknown Unknown, Strain D1" /LENGTH=77 /DNA_ID=CAMNT_0016470295 /DNA_START=53 /DNA_END=283 /DNA_ORIENTATION=-
MAFVEQHLQRQGETLPGIALSRLLWQTVPELSDDQQGGLLLLGSLHQRTQADLKAVWMHKWADTEALQGRQQWQEEQ